MQNEINIALNEFQRLMRGRTDKRLVIAEEILNNFLSSVVKECADIAKNFKREGVRDCAFRTLNQELEVYKNQIASKILKLTETK